MKLRKEDYPEVPGGWWVAELVDIKEFTSQKNPQYGMSLNFIFRVLEGEGAGSQVTGLCTPTWRPGNKLDAWLTGLGLNSAEVGTEIDPGALKGRRARINVEKNAKTGYTNIKYVTALREGEGVAPAIPQAPAMPKVAQMPVYQQPPAQQPPVAMPTHPPYTPPAAPPPPTWTPANTPPAAWPPAPPTWAPPATAPTLPPMNPWNPNIAPQPGVPF